MRGTSRITGPGHGGAIPFTGAVLKPVCVTGKSSRPVQSPPSTGSWPSGRQAGAEVSVDEVALQLRVRQIRVRGRTGLLSSARGPMTRALVTLSKCTRIKILQPVSSVEAIALALSPASSVLFES